ncbi:MAG: hypothetical protein IPP17_31210 [Bacteroidetes bacterium]|nr:hypothetical protein [Bacteroidota bacterium]
MGFVLGPWTPIHAQAGEVFPLKGKRVAVYFSKKHFTFDDNYRIPLSQFIKSDQGENAEIEDIKLQTLVALGTLFAQQLKKPSAADSTYFPQRISRIGVQLHRRFQFR